MKKDSGAKQLMEYGFLVVFANDDAISEGELKMIEKLALRDGEVDEEEKAVLRNIFERANKMHMDQATRDEIARFREQYRI
jgi:DNA-binding transcriptional regulator/RsmH inhibitor MraZ